MNTQFWKDKKVLVTGHSGFKGSWLSFILNSLGAQVIGISKEELNNNKDLFKALKIESICDSFDVDIRDMSGIQDIFF